MAFANTNMSFGGAQHGSQANSTTQRALFLKVFSGEVMTAYERAIKIAPLLTTRTITSGKTAQFPTTGYAAARYFSQGDSLLEDNSDAGNHYLSTIKQSERNISIDDLLVSSCFISELDEAMSHYDYRSAFATELGNALARHQDKYALQVIHDAATAAALDSDEVNPGVGTTVTIGSTAYADITSAQLLDAIYDAAKALDEKDVPRDDRFVVLSPTHYYLLLKAGVLTVPAMTGGGTSDGTHGGLQAAYSDSRMLFSGANDYPSASITMVAGMPVIMSNNTDFDVAAPMHDTLFGDSHEETKGSFNLNATTNSGATGAATASSQDKTCALVFHKGCAGVVRLKDITMESEYVIERQGTLMVAKLASGMGRLRNQGAVRIASSGT